MQSLLAEMDTNILRLLREELSACFSALLRLLLIVLGKSPSCSSCIYTVRLTAGSAYCWRCLKMFCLGNSALLYLCLWCKMSSLRPADSLSVQNIGKKKKSLDYVKTPARLSFRRSSLIQSAHLVRSSSSLKDKLSLPLFCVNWPLWSHQWWGCVWLREPGKLKRWRQCQDLRLMSGSSASLADWAWALTGHSFLNAERIYSCTSAWVVCI